eukprot:CAMPEP_0198594704 /NCGR_PEP_ID=MMETSP1462-20131121/140983_1 /TAXON_ID=1333877 /ORGANISM="Brandtodinium nutriculum, Strain RCC3387" /LENGTH=75 /DNA_ID=CAMNT_0044326321 /DNA_START=22 /DNA_END=246 /DNA_ORIENTATION=+
MLAALLGRVAHPPAAARGGAAAVPNAKGALRARRRLQLQVLVFHRESAVAPRRHMRGGPRLRPAGLDDREEAIAR